jgi:predicted dehydrogenase
MKFLVIGRGSMGSRRIRDLIKLGHEVISWDIKDKEPLITVDTDWDAMVISTSPDQHNYYIERSLEVNKPCFVEASVILDNLEELNDIATSKKVLVCPSCSYKFHPQVKELKEKVNTIQNFTHHLGQNLEDWHPGANPMSYYAYHKEVGAAKEMVSYELTWLINLFGFPKKLVGFKKNTKGWAIDDTYSFSADFNGVIGNCLIEVVSRPMIRRFSTNELTIDFEKCEQIYFDEIKAFVDAIEGKSKFPNTLKDDIKVLKLLEQLENG